MNTLYARLEPANAPKNRRDAVFYADPERSQRVAVVPWHHTGRPTTRRVVTINCTRWDVVWEERA